MKLKSMSRNTVQSAVEPVVCKMSAEWAGTVVVPVIPEVPSMSLNVPAGSVTPVTSLVVGLTRTIPDSYWRAQTP